MNACRDAIPPWIMPFYRVAESLSAAREAFDVVIVVEASQSGPETLILLYLAKKCIIVGDRWS
jgi:superfamily I DNA and/or RNA helicase